MEKEKEKRKKENKKGDSVITREEKSK